MSVQQIENDPQEFALYCIHQSGGQCVHSQRNTTPSTRGRWSVCVCLCVCCFLEKRKLSNRDQPLWERILQGPSDDIMKIFLMDRDEEEVSIDVSLRAPPPHWASALIPTVQHCQNWDCTIRGVKQSHPWQKWRKMKQGQHSLKRQPPVQYLNSPVEGSNRLTGRGLHSFTALKYCIQEKQRL